MLSGVPIAAIAAGSSGSVFAGSVGKTHYSDDLGASWNVVTPPTTYAIHRIFETPNGTLFALAGTVDSALGFLDSGVLYSNNNGATWTARNTGLGAYLHAEQIAADRNGSLYLAIADESRTGGGGLFISDNSGQSWQLLTVTIDGRGAVPNTIGGQYLWFIRFA